MSLHKQINVIITKGGELEHIYDQEFITKTQGENKIENIARASNVEPDEQNIGQWYVDLAPVKGPFLRGFKTRNEALIMEVKWLNENYYVLKGDEII